jgi:hypothetical protein
MALDYFSFLLFAFLQLLQSIHAQNISTTAAIPPLQWINLTGLLRGSTQPPPLKDAAIGYDETRFVLECQNSTLFLTSS